MAKGNPGGNPKNFPFPKYKDEEKLLIAKLARYRESFSNEDIARILNDVFKDYNKGCRTGDGIKKFLSKPAAQ